MLGPKQHQRLRSTRHSSCPNNGSSTKWPAQLRARSLCVSRATPNSSDPFDPLTRRALREAGELLAEAQELAQQQAIAQLRSSWAADEAVAVAPQSSDAALQAFLVEQGLGLAAAERLLVALKADPRLAASCLSTQALAAKLSSLQRVLPGADVALLVAEEPQLLTGTSGQMVNNLVALVNGLPGHDVTSMVLRRPSLLLVTDMPDRLRRITAKLLQLHPSHEPAVIAGILQENPELLFRMDYYLSDDVRLIDELPIEIQNMMVLGDSGVGFLYRYWRERRAQERRDQQQQGRAASAGAGEEGHK